MVTVITAITYAHLPCIMILSRRLLPPLPLGPPVLHKAITTCPYVANVNRPNR